MKLSIIDKNILIYLSQNDYSNQRSLMSGTGYSLGSVNKSLTALTEYGFLDSKMKLTKNAKKYLKDNSPKNAIILAAGYGMRMVPINTETPKGLLTVDGQPLVERTIDFLHEAGVTDISIVVGFMMEAYDYLVDKYGIKMIYNNDYAIKNNLHSLALAAGELSNTYIIPCDIWSENNPFSSVEAYSWYMVSDLEDEESWIRVNRKSELAHVLSDGRSDKKNGNRMIGISYVCGEESEKLRTRLGEMALNPMYNESFWEEAAFDADKMYLSAKVASHKTVAEVNTYEQLRELDKSSRNLENEAIKVAAKALGKEPADIRDITVLKKGMTNRSFLFKCDNEKYIMRIPGEGTENLINRVDEAAVYDAIKDRGICDDIVYLNPDNGYKITRFIDNSRNCDPLNQDDLDKCMKKLRDFHDLKLKVPHKFGIIEHIEYYESLWSTTESIYRDYRDTKEKVLSLKDYIDSQNVELSLAHIDSVPDNFMLVSTASDEEEVKLIDWEYAGLQDRYVDIAMFCIYALYDQKQVDNLIDTYFRVGGLETDEEIKSRIYAYISMCGLLWSNWCEYKRGLGVDFGEYSLRQYRFAKDYYKLFMDRKNKTLE